MSPGDEMIRYIFSDIVTSYLVKRLQVPQRHVVPRRYTSGNVETISHLPTSMKINVNGL